MSDSEVGGGGPRVRPQLACFGCGHEHFFEADDAGFDSAETIPWGHCKTCACKAPNYNYATLAAQLADLRGDRDQLLQRLRDEEAARLELHAQGQQFRVNLITRAEKAEAALAALRAERDKAKREGVSLRALVLGWLKEWVER